MTSMYYCTKGEIHVLVDGGYTPGKQATRKQIRCPNSRGQNDKLSCRDGECKLYHLLSKPFTERIEKSEKRYMLSKP
ncbi:hypothetical protein J4466_01510 [Candidatus Pacearchaeota archaeon]|nr:hypothetical protein [Candidatus Pacearchaeota archaeon]